MKMKTKEKSCTVGGWYSYPLIYPPKEDIHLFSIRKEKKRKKGKKRKKVIQKEANIHILWIIHLKRTLSYSLFVKKR